MTKAEVYKLVIDMQKQSGQGCSGIVKLGNDPTVAGHLDELVEEGVIKACDTGGSIGHPESNIFYMPTKGYNVWEDDGGEYTRHKGKYLHYVRFYLGILDNEDKGDFDDVSDDDRLGRALNPTMFDYLRDPEVMTEYSKWLTRNSEELKIMRNLDDYYDEPVIKFTQEEKDYIMTRGWYTKNKTISDCLTDSKEAVSNHKERISVNKKLIDLYRRDDKYADDMEKSKADIKDSERIILGRKKLHRWLEGQNMEDKIQDVFDGVTLGGTFDKEETV